ncbi:MAG: hypothetical protein EXR48_06945 [Dehalococcoidia bacterium]|nr:hypothetical protein [Dehalococcoidia bacterium]
MTMVTYCTNHKSTETGLRCGKCDKPICGRCVVFTPVGTRCRECARLTRIPTYNVGAAYFARGLAAGMAVALGIGVLGGYLLKAGVLPVPYLFGPLMLAGIGYVTAEAVSLATNRKRGPILLAVAVTSFIAGYLALEILTPGTLVVAGLWGIAAFIVAIAVIVGRLR